MFLCILEKPCQLSPEVIGNKKALPEQGLKIVIAGLNQKIQFLGFFIFRSAGGCGTGIVLFLLFPAGW